MHRFHCKSVRRAVPSGMESNERVLAKDLPDLIIDHGVALGDTCAEGLNVFIYNKDIINAYDELKDKIDYDYYIYRIYERIGEFIK